MNIMLKVVVCLLLVTISFSNVSPVCARITNALVTARYDRLRKHDRGRMLEALVRGKKEVPLIIASRRGANATVVRAVTALGGTIKYRDDDVDYLRVNVPIGNVESVARIPDVDAMDVDGEPHYYSGVKSEASASRPVQAGDNHRSIVAPDARTPANNPYLPTKDMGVPQFIAKHPTFDGRGVTMAIVEGYPDFLVPELQTATTLDGKATPKIVDVLDVTDPNEEASPTFVKMADEVVAADGCFTYKDSTFIAPANGPYRIGTLNERASGDPLLGRDFNRDGNPEGSSGEFTVLWNEATNTVWVDTNQDRNFANEKAMQQYKVRRDLGILGNDNPKTPMRESIAFAVQIYAGDKYVEIQLGVGGHTTNVASVAAGQRFFSGAMNGVAPGAQLVLVRAGNIGDTNHAAIESMIAAVKDPRVDLIAVQYGNIMRLNDGNFVTTVIWDRLIERYQKPIFNGSGNEGPALETVMELSTGSKVISAGAYISKETLRTNYGVVATKEDNVWDFSSRGPREDGAIKPDVLTPSGVLASSPLIYHSNPYFPKYVKFRSPYELPPGYDIFAGTSCAGPMAAGAAALLISAAKQSGVKYDAERLRRAFLLSARYLSELNATEQGHGLVQVEEAWNALKTWGTVPKLVSSAPVRTVLSQYLKTPNLGTGIYEREGWQPGQRETRMISFTRKSGPARAAAFRLQWIGNDGTFSSAGALNLPLNVPTKLPVTINPRSSGVHSAILRLLNEKRIIVHEVMNTVVAAEQFTTANEFVVKSSATADYPGKLSFFLNVPKGAAALHCNLHIANGNLRLRFADPSGTIFQLAHPFYPGRGAHSYQLGGEVNQSFENPEPGVWEVYAENGNIDANTPQALQSVANVTLTATLFRNEVTLDSKSPSGAVLNVKVSNNGAALNGAISDISLASAFSAQPLIKQGAFQVYEIGVPSGAMNLRARIGNSSARSADLDLYVFDCTRNECVRRDQSTSDGSEESIAVGSPAAGKWKIVIDPVRVPTGRTTCNYTDLFLSPALGELKSLDQAQMRDSLASWQTKVEVKSIQAPPAPRYLAAFLSVRSSEVFFEEARFNMTTREPEPSIRVPVSLGNATISLATQFSLPK